MNDYANFYRQIAELERQAERGNRRQRRSGAAWERTPEANAPQEVPRFSPQEVQRLERETEVESARQRARREYSPLPDEAGPLVPLTAMVGDLVQAPNDAILAREGDPRAQRRLGERDARWSRGAERAGQDILAEGHGGQLMQFFSDLPEQMDEAERARLEAGGRDAPLDRVGSVLGGLWTGMASVPREARGEVAAQDAIRAQHRDDAAEAMARGDDIGARSAALSGRMAEQAGDRSAGEDFWYNAPWAAEFVPGVGLVDMAASAGRFGARQGWRAAGQEIPEALARPQGFAETQRLGVRTGEVGANGEDILYSATGNARGWRNNAAAGGAAYLAADSANGEVGDDPAAVMLGGATMAYGRRFIPNIDSAIPEDIQHLARQGEIGPDGARNYTPNPRQRLTVDPEGRVAMDYEGSFNAGDGASVGEVRTLMRGAREAINDDIATTRRSEYSWTPNGESQARLYRNEFERNTPENYAFSETPQGEMRLRRLGAEFEPDPLPAQRVPDDEPFGFEGAPSQGRIIDAEATSAPQRRFEAAVRDPATGQVYRGEDHQQAIDSAPDEAVRARLQAAYDAVDEDPSIIGFQVDGEFMGREQGMDALRARAGRSRQVRIGEQVNRDGSVTPRSEIDWDSPNTRLPADDEWFNNLAGMPTPPRMNIVPDGGIPGRSADDMLREPRRLGAESAPDGGASGAGNVATPLYDAFGNQVNMGLPPLPEMGPILPELGANDRGAIERAAALLRGENTSREATYPLGVRRVFDNHGPASEGFRRIEATREQQFDFDPQNIERRRNPWPEPRLAVDNPAPDAPNAGPRRLGGDDTPAAATISAGGLGGYALGEMLDDEAQAADGSESDGAMLPILTAGGGAAALYAMRRGRLGEQFGDSVGMSGGRGARRLGGERGANPDLGLNAVETEARTAGEQTGLSAAQRGALTPDQSYIIERRMQGADYNTIADEMSTAERPVTTNTVTVQISKARRRLGDAGMPLEMPRAPMGRRAGEGAATDEQIIALRDQLRAQGESNAKGGVNTIIAERFGMNANAVAQRISNWERRRSTTGAAAGLTALGGGALLLGDEAQAQETIDGMVIDREAELPSYTTAVGAPQAYGEYAVQEFSDGTRYVFRIDRSGAQVSLEPLGALRGMDAPSERVGDVYQHQYDNSLPSEPYTPPPREEGPRRLGALRPALAGGAGVAASLLVPGRYGNATRMALSGGATGLVDTALGGDWTESLPLAAGVAGGGELLRYGADDVVRRLGTHGEDAALALDPTFRAQRDAFARTLPDELPTVRVTETENYHGEIQRPDEGMFGGQPFVVPGDEMASQGYSYNRPVERMPTQREQFLDAPPAVQRAWMDRAERPQIGAASEGADPERVARGMDVRRRLGEPPAPAREQADPFIAPETGASVFGEPRRMRAPRAPLPPLAERAEAAGAQGAMRGVRAAPMREIADDLGIASEGRPVGELRKAIVRELGRRFDSTREMTAFLARYGVTAAAIGIGVGAAYTEQKQQRRLS